MVIDSTGHLDINGTIDAKSSVQINSLNITGNTDIDGTLDVAGTSQLNSLNVTDNVDIDGTLNTQGATNLQSTLTVAGNTDLNGTLDVANNTQLNSLNVTGNTDIDGTLDIEGGTNLQSTLTVAGHTDLNNTLNVQGVGTFQNDLVVDTNTLFVDASTNRIGINNASPESTLHLTGVDGLVIPIGTNAQRLDITGMIRYNTDTSTFEGFKGTWGSLGGVIDVDQDTYVSAETSAGADNDQLLFFTSGSERMKIDSDGDIDIPGKIGIGTDAGSHDLTINDTLFVKSTTNSSQLIATGSKGISLTYHDSVTTDKGFLVSGDSTSSWTTLKPMQIMSSQIEFNTSTSGASNGIVTITADGLGIDAVPTEYLTLGNSANIRLNGSGGSQNGNGNIYFSGTTKGFGGNSNDMKFFSGSTTLMHFNLSGGGNMAIGSDVGLFQNDKLLLTGGAHRSTIRFQNSGTGNNTNDGTVIGYEASTNTKDFIIANREDGYLSFETNSTERLRIESGGNIGIGTDDPSHKLDVIGDINSTTNFKINSTQVLGATTLGSNVVNSSLTNVGTLSALNVVGNTSLDGAVVLERANSTNEGGEIRLKMSDDSNTWKIDCYGGSTSQQDLRLFSSASGNKVKIQSDLEVNGDINANGSINLQDQAILQSTLEVQGVSQLASVNVTGNADVDGTLNIQGVGSFQDDLVVDTDKFVVDISTGKVGMGIAVPANHLDVYQATGNTNVKFASAAGNSVFQLQAANTGSSIMRFADGDDNNIGRIDYNHSTNTMGLRTNDSEAISINSSQKVTINADLEVATTSTFGGNMDINGDIDISGNSWVGGTLNVVGNSDFNGDLEVDGNLTVHGTTTTINTTQMTIEDPILELGSNNGSDAVDLGFYGKYVSSSTANYSGLIRDATDGKFKLFNTQTIPTTTINTETNSFSYSDLVIGSLNANGTINVSGESQLNSLKITGKCGIGTDVGSHDLTINDTLFVKSTTDYTQLMATGGKGVTLSYLDGVTTDKGYLISRDATTSWSTLKTMQIMASQIEFNITNNGANDGIVRITEDGMGIGNINPTEYLTIGSSGNIRLDGSGGSQNSTGNIYFSGTTKGFGGSSSYMKIFSGSDTLMSFSLGDSKVGIGSNPTTFYDKLLLSASGNYATMRFQNTGTGSGFNDGAVIGYDGSASAINFTIANHENGYLSFETNSTERMKILNTGETEINGFVTITNQDNTNGQLLIEPVDGNGSLAKMTIRGHRDGSTTDNSCQLVLENYDEDTPTTNKFGMISGICTNAATNIGDMIFSTYSDGSTNSERLRITSDGNVAIGNTSPSYKLDVVGDINFTGDLRMSGSIIDLTPVWSSNSTARYYNDGYIGIGTNDPKCELHIVDGSSGCDLSSLYDGVKQIIESNSDVVLDLITDTGNSEIWFGDANKNNNGRLRYENNNHKMEFWCDNSVKMVIDSSGLVGISKETPEYRLDVNGSVRLINNIVFGDTANTKFVIHTRESNNGDFMTIAPDTEDGTSFEWDKNLCLTRDGNVAIGNTSPSYKLDVSGDINLTGTLYQNGVEFSSGSPNFSQNFLSLDNDNAENTTDIGIYGQYVISSVTNYEGFARDATDGVWKLFKTTTKPTTVFVGSDEASGNNAWWPPQYMTANTETLNDGIDEQDGEYVVTTSSVQGTAEGYRAFNDAVSGNTAWSSVNPTYGASNGIYSGSENLTGDYEGEWIKIKMPKKVLITQYIVGNISSSHKKRSPIHFRLVGSNDDSTWTTINSQTLSDSSSWSSGPISKTYSVTPGVGFQYFALIIQKVGGYGPMTVGRELCNIGYLSFYGQAMVEGDQEYSDLKVNNLKINGNVGIGTDSPDVSLHVLKDHNSFTQIECENRGTGTTASAVMKCQGASGAIWMQVFDDGFTTSGAALADSGLLSTGSSNSGGLGIRAYNASGDIHFWSGGNNERMRILSTGNVGIGTSTPTYKLDVSGTFRATGAATFDSIGYFNRNNSTAEGGEIQLQMSDGSSTWVIDSYGTTTNQQYLRIFNNSGQFKFSYDGKFAIGNINPTIDLAINDADTGLNLESAGELAVYTGGSERVRFNSSGNVGI